MPRLLDFTLLTLPMERPTTQKRHYYHYYHFVHDKFTEKVIDGLHLIFVELPKFKPTTFSERKMQVLWLRFLTEIDEHTKEAPAELLENAEVNTHTESLTFAPDYR